MPKNNWKEVTIEEIVEITGGGTPSTKNPDYWGGNIPFLVPKEVTNFDSRYINKTERYITEEGLNNSSAKLIPSNTILMTSRATIGEAVINLVPMATNQGFINIIPKRVDLYYFYYWIKANVKFLKKFSHGTTFKELIKSVFKKVKILLPPAQIQIRTGKFLSIMDDLIENNFAKINTLNSIMDYVFQRWFLEYKFPNSIDIQLINSNIGKIPKGWRLEKIGDTVKTMGGGTPSTKNPEFWEKGNINWYTPTDITSNNQMFLFNSQKKITDLGLSKSSAKIFPPYSVMMTSRATVGEVSINTTEACTNQGFIIIIPNEELPFLYIFLWIKHNKKKILKFASGSTFKEISRTNFRALQILLPDQSIMNKFKDYLQPIANLIEILEERIVVLKKMKNLLLYPLISGDIKLLL